MKKTLNDIKMLVALLLAGAAMAACSSDDELANTPTTTPEPAPATETYTMIVEATKGSDAGSRALADAGTTLTATWTVGDVVGVYSEDGATHYGDIEAQSSGASTTLKGELSSVPSNGATLLLKYLSPSYDTQDGTLTGNEHSLDKVCDYATATVTATVDGTTVTTSTANFVNQQAVVKFTLTNSSGNAINPTAFTVSDGTNTTTLSNIPEETYTKNGDGVIYVALPGFSDKTVNLTATVDDDTYTYEKAGISFTNSNFYRISVKMAKAVAGPQAVDLGLSVKWANMNIGAEKETDYGLFFAWGETTGYSSSDASDHTFDWANYKWCNGEKNKLTKYVPTNEKSYWDGTGNPDNKLTLEPEDDAAHVNWGGAWRMPTQQEWQALLDNTTKQWTTVNGIAGYKFTSTKTGYTDKSIFLPAAGYRYDTTLATQGTVGNYWSSSVSTDIPFWARELYFPYGNASVNSSDRCYGRSVRAVQP